MQGKGARSDAAKGLARIRTGAILAFLGLAAYGGMFISFGITDIDVSEVIGGIGLVVAGVGILLLGFGYIESR